MSQIVRAFRTPKEKIYQKLMLFFGISLWIFFGLLVVAAFDNPKLWRILSIYVYYGVAITLFIFISSAAYRAYAFGNMILLGPKQFPELYTTVVAGSQALGMSEPPKAFLYNSNGLVNAFARRLLGGKYIFLTSALVEAQNDAQVRFIIGHELGHHAAGHLNPWMNTLKLPAHIVPFLAPAYSRARELTCDGIGAHLSGDAVASRSSLLMLGCGCRRLNGAMNCDAFLAQEAMVPPFFGFLTEIFRSHPRLTRRVAAIANNAPAVTTADHEGDRIFKAKPAE